MSRVENEFREKDIIFAFVDLPCVSWVVLLGFVADLP